MNTIYESRYLGDYLERRQILIQEDFTYETLKDLIKILLNGYITGRIGLSMLIDYFNELESSLLIDYCGKQKKIFKHLEVCFHVIRCVLRGIRKGECINEEDVPTLLEYLDKPESVESLPIEKIIMTHEYKVLPEYRVFIPDDLTLENLNDFLRDFLIKYVIDKDVKENSDKEMDYFFLMDFAEAIDYFLEAKLVVYDFDKEKYFHLSSYIRANGGSYPYILGLTVLNILNNISYVKKENVKFFLSNVIEYLDSSREDEPEATERMKKIW